MRDRRLKSNYAKSALCGKMLNCASYQKRAGKCGRQKMRLLKMTFIFDLFLLSWGLAEKKIIFVKVQETCCRVGSCCHEVVLYNGACFVRLGCTVLATFFVGSLVETYRHNGPQPVFHAFWALSSTEAAPDGLSVMDASRCIL